MLLKRISDGFTWISELEMFHFMLSMYLSSWWWVHGCMDEVQHITTGVMRCVISLYHICPFKVRAYNSKGELKKCCSLLVNCFMYVLLLVCRYRGL